MTASDLRKLIGKTWEEFTLLGKEEDIDLKMTPDSEKKPILSRLVLTGDSEAKNRLSLREDAGNICLDLRP